MSMTEAELIETLAAQEHESWARWQAYVHSLCAKQEDGSLLIPTARVTFWEAEIATPYTDLPDELKQFDRDEVAHILPIIRQFAGVES